MDVRDMRLYHIPISSIHHLHTRSAYSGFYAQLDFALGHSNIQRIIHIKCWLFDLRSCFVSPHFSAWFFSFILSLSLSSVFCCCCCSSHRCSLVVACCLCVEFMIIHRLIYGSCVLLSNKREIIGKSFHLFHFGQFWIEYDDKHKFDVDGKNWLRIQKIYIL